MLTEVRISGRKLFHRGVWRVRINGHRWLYDGAHDCFMEKNGGKVISKEDMPSDVQLGFKFALEGNELVLHDRYSERRSYGWKLLIGNLQAEGRDIVVVSRGRRMGFITLTYPANPLKNIPILPPRNL